MHGKSPYIECRFTKAPRLSQPRVFRQTSQVMTRLTRILDLTRTKLSRFQGPLCLLRAVDRFACLFCSLASLLLLNPLLLLDHLNVKRVRQNRRDARELVQFCESRASSTFIKLFGAGVWAEESENAVLGNDSRCPDSCIDENINTSPP
jgi:hypothetical protein